MNKKINDILSYFDKLVPNAKCELNYFDDFSLLIAIILSAQTTDKKVNLVTKQLFLNHEDVYKLNSVSLEDLIKIIHPLGLANNKAKNIKKLCKILIDDYDGQVPKDFNKLTSLPGVGIKTANVFLSEYYHIPAIAVDTHVKRIATRLNLASESDTPLKVEQKLEKLIDKQFWIKTHHQMIFFGRYHCLARSPKCESCPVLNYCQEGKRKLNIK